MRHTIAQLNRRFDFVGWLIVILSSVGWVWFIWLMMGCQSSTTIKGGESEASATTTTSRMRVNVTNPQPPTPVVTVRVRITEGENPCR